MPWTDAHGIRSWDHVDHRNDGQAGQSPPWRKNDKKWSVKDGSAGKESTCSAGDIEDTVLIPGSGRSPGGGHGNPLQYSLLENLMDRGVWWATVHRVMTSGTHMHATKASDPNANICQVIFIWNVEKWLLSTRVPLDSQIYKQYIYQANTKNFTWSLRDKEQQRIRERDAFIYNSL